MSRARQNSLSRLNQALPVPIVLSNEEDLPQSYNFSHISNVFVGDHHVIQGEVGKPYIVWTVKITINESNFSSITLYKRYSDFFEFRKKIIHATGDANIPPLPPKDDFSLDRWIWSANWLEERKKGLQWFLSNILLNPKYQHLEVVSQFILGG